jgi:Cu/Ag efflux pump CusA
VVDASASGLIIGAVLRPIMMTTLAALLGAVPIAVGYGAGGEARQPLELVVVGGLLFSPARSVGISRRSFTPTWRSCRPSRLVMAPVDTPP